MQERQTYFDDKLTQLQGEREKYEHYRHKFYVSNTKDPDARFELIREKISEVAQNMQLWGKSVPLKWIFFEHLIDVNRDNGKHFISFDDMIMLAKHPKIAISEIWEVSTFLHFQHEVGKIVFFKDIPDLIILQPQWLANAFRCLVSDRFNIDNVKGVTAKEKHQISLDWTHLKKKGEISDLLINTLFKLKGGDSFLTQKNQLLKVMTKFDILLEIEGTTSYIMPSMFPQSSISTVLKNIGIHKDNCQRTSWFCMKFDFLPPSFFNHLLVWLMKNYCPSKMTSTEGFALYRGICAFDFKTSECEKLLITMSIDSIALQVVSFPQHEPHLQEVCTSVRTDIRRKIIDIKKRYGIKLSYKQMFKCSDSSSHSDAKSFEELKEKDKILCSNHKAHTSATLCLPWVVERTEVGNTIMHFNYLILQS